jgi:ribulose-5-phosphate 4-epimerase/fuculose-1-phosphate aldolase
MTTETELREDICRIAQSLFDRGLTHGSTGNISARLPDGGWLMTPTGSSLGRLDPGRLSKLDSLGTLVSGDKPTKEAFLHTTMYDQRPEAGAVVHLHSTYSVAISCRADVDHADCLPPLTAYYCMRIGRLPIVPFYPPGDKALADAVGKFASDHHAVLLANHGPVVAGKTLNAATDAVEELEETARLFLMLEGRPLKPLSESERQKLGMGVG